MTGDYFLGCPSWGLSDWVGTLYRRGSKSKDFLTQYARVFNTVEGNTTFYGVPNAETVERWRDATPESFHFCFKVPRAITHERALVGVDREMTAFLDRLRPLGPRLGPIMVQLPPAFAPQHLDRLERLLATLPSDLCFAVEVRHREFYDHDDTRRRLDDLLAHFACERVIMDTRALRSGPAGHPDVAQARFKKPDLPVAPVALGRRPLLRFISHPEDDVNTPWLGLWAGAVAGWIREGRRPYVFVHCPNDRHSPGTARRFHGILSEILAKDSRDLSPMPEWPGEEPVEEKGQLSLF